LTTKKITHIADAAASEAYAERHPARVAAVELGGIRSVLTVPLLKENKLIGAFALARQEVRPFTEKQIALLTNFAAQAVIAMRMRGCSPNSGSRWSGKRLHQWFFRSSAVR
jgi:GAF domain-containing protein